MSEKVKPICDECGAIRYDDGEERHLESPDRLPCDECFEWMEADE